jgi:predicted outer membrane protein
MRTAAIVLLTVLAAACSRSGARAAETFDAQRFVITTTQSTIANADLGILAARRGRRPETRQLGSILHRQQLDLQHALAAIAQRKHLGVPNVMEPRKVALRENLEILPGEVFDRGYALAMVQDLDAMSASLQRAARSGDRDLASFASQNLPRIREERELAASLLKSLGGSPFS